MANDLNINIGDGEEEQSEETSLIRDVIKFCGGPDLIQIFGETGSCKSTFAVEVARSAVEDANKEVLFIDTEKNLSDNDRVNGVDYIYIPDWDDIYAYITQKPNMLSENPFGTNTTGSNTLESGYSVVVLDSMGLPALIQYDEYSIIDDADQFKIFQMFQHISGELKKYAQLNDSLIIATNQPGSKLGDDGGHKPFGDKSQFAFKELWRSYKESSSSVKTTCSLKAHRSRQAGEDAKLFKIEVDDEGVVVTDMTDKDAQMEEWT